LTKPATSGALLEAINKAIYVSREEPPPTPDIDSKTMPTILIADDDSNNRILVMNILKRSGYQVIIARDGREAVELFSTGAPDLILMDVQMPNLSGLDAAAEIRKRESPSGRRIPIIALTARAMAGDRERCLAAGMDDFLSKPVRANDLLAKISNFTAPAVEK
jgi:two-component system sensor histidine kinase/response regulator